MTLPHLPHPGEAVTLPPQSDDATSLIASAALILPRPFGRYRLERLLGQGGMGIVYLAQDTQLNRAVAMKVPTLTGGRSDSAKARFVREAQAAAALQHPNICPIYDIGEIDGVLYLTMAFLQGEALSHRIQNRKPFEPRAAAELVRKLALALQSAHALGVIHRDLKPGNIMMDDRGEPIIMDFGLARRADLVSEQLTHQGDILGTPAYMSPEQMLGEIAMMGPGCDIYSLGVILFELLTGTPPFRGDLPSLVSQVTLDDPPPPSCRRPGIDPRFDAICLKALAKLPSLRFSSMQAFADELTPLVEADRPKSSQGQQIITLRVLGTPYAYRPLPNQQYISVGRQRRKPGEPDDTGNDVVLRVPGNSDLSTRISRRHFEIHREADGYFVTDRSKVGTELNGALLTREMPVPLNSGDRLVVAGVVELEVVFHASGPARLVRPEVLLPGVAGIILEATLGDMVTTE
jgi:serine/threonine protein kinase